VTDRFLGFTCLEETPEVTRCRSFLPDRGSTASTLPSTIAASTSALRIRKMDWYSPACGNGQVCKQTVSGIPPRSCYRSRWISNFDKSASPTSVWRQTVYPSSVGSVCDVQFQRPFPSSTLLQKRSMNWPRLFDVSLYWRTARQPGQQVFVLAKNGSSDRADLLGHQPSWSQKKKEATISSFRSWELIVVLRDTKSS
jgi:hypothetical protein